MKKLIYLSILIPAVLVVVSMYFYKTANEKIDEVAQKGAHLIEEKTGLTANISEVSFNLMSLEVIAGIELLRNDKTVFKANKCKIEDVHRIYFFKEQNIQVVCESATFEGNQVPDLLKQYASYGSGESADKEKLRLAGNKYQVDLSIQRMEFVFNNVVSFFSFDLKFYNGNGKLNMKILDDDAKTGLLEILFNQSFDKTDILFDKIPLTLLKDTIAAMTGLNNVSGIVDGYVNIVRNSSELKMDIDVSVKNLTVEHPLIDWQPYRLSFLRFSGNVDADILKREAATENASLSLGGIDAVLSASYESHKREFLLDMKKVALNKVVTLVSNDVFKGYSFDGEIDMFLTYLKENDDDPVFSIIGEVIDPIQRSDRLDYLKESFQYEFTDKFDEKVSFRVGEGGSKFLSYDMIPEHVIWAVVISEDAGFFKHKGVDFEEMSAAVKDNIKKNKLRGGSTITQQIAKNLFLKKEKTFLRKFREVILAIELDATLSKRRLLEIYLNIAEWAPGVFGISDASWHYFGKPAYMLTPLEGAYLASVVPGPYKYQYQFLSGKINEKWTGNLHRILDKMNETGHLTFKEYINAVNDEIIFRTVN